MGKSLTIIISNTVVFMYCTLLACNNNTKDSPDSGKTGKGDPKTNPDTILTEYVYDGDTDWLIESSKKNGKIVQKKYYKWSIDTSYFENGKPSMTTLVIDAGSGSYIHSEFYQNGKLKHKWQEAGINGGIATTVDYFYDSTGILVSKNSFRYGSGTYHETHVILETVEFHPNGKMKLKKFSEYFLMGEQCDCGIWEYYDENGKLKSKETKESCEDGKLGCLK